jgi:hypothetical protein
VEAPPILTKPLIAALVDDELDRARARFARWEHPYSGLEFSRARRILGQAHRDGRIRLSTVFVDTRAHADLRDTIRHEFAHLIAGLRARHGAPWRQVAAALNAKPRAAGAVVCPELRARMDDAPFDLVAVLKDGREVVLRAAYRRAPQYLDYRAGRTRRQYFYRGAEVAYFRYDPRRLK